MHDFTSYFIGVVSKQVIDESRFVSSQSCFADLAQEQLAIFE